MTKGNGRWIPILRTWVCPACGSFVTDNPLMRRQHVAERCPQLDRVQQHREEKSHGQPSTNEGQVTQTHDRVLCSEAVVPATSVSVYEALHRRRMAWKFEKRAVPRDALERMLAAAIWAPNHRLTEPWRFFVLKQGSIARQRLGDRAYHQVLGRTGDAERARRISEWVFAQPVLLFTYSVPGPDEEVTRENYAAAVCALHNVNLGGVAEGLAVTWETGGVAKLDGLHQVLGAEPEWQLVAMASVGYPAEEFRSSRTPFTQFIRWL